MRIACGGKPCYTWGGRRSGKPGWGGFMELFFYCTPQSLKEMFGPLESTEPLIYQPSPFCAHPSRIAELDCQLYSPLFSLKEFYNFGRAYSGTPPILIWSPKDAANEKYLPISLRFSGPPVCMDDEHVLCEDPVFLSPENKEPAPRALYKKIRSCFTQYFVKSG